MEAIVGGASEVIEMIGERQPLTGKSYRAIIDKGRGDGGDVRG